MRSLDQAARELKKFSRDLDRNILRAEYKTAQVGQKQAVKQSSGRIKSDQLRKEGHPYAVKWTVRGKWFYQGVTAPYRDPSIINDQSGDFRKDWKIVTVNLTKSGGWMIVNYSPIAEYLADGTRYMVKRPLEDKVIDAMKKVRISNLDKAVSSAMK